MAMARPPSVIVLIDRPKYLKTSAVMKIDTGIAVSAMTVGRSVPRKKNRITATKTDAPISLPCSVVIEASMKLAWRKVTRGASMPAGSDVFSPTSASSMDCGERDGVGGRLLLDAQDHRRLAFEAGVAALDGRQRRSPRRSGAAGSAGRSCAVSARLLQVVEPRGAAEVADQVLAAVEFQEAARGVGRDSPSARLRAGRA